MWFYFYTVKGTGFPDGSNVKESACSAGDLGSILVLGRFPWRRDCLPNPVFLPGEFHGQNSLAGYSPVQFSSVAQLYPTLCNPMDCSMPGFHVHHHLQEFAQTHVHWVGDANQPSHPHCPLLLLPSIFPSMSLFEWVSSSYQVAEYWSFSFNISPSNEYWVLISFRMD